MPVNNGKIRGLSPWLSDDLSGRERRLAGRFLEKLIDDSPNGACDSKAFRGAMEATARQPRTIFRDDGDFGGPLANADERARTRKSKPRSPSRALHVRPWSRRPRRLHRRWQDEGLRKRPEPHAAHDLRARFLGLAPE